MFSQICYFVIRSVSPFTTCHYDLAFRRWGQQPIDYWYDLRTYSDFVSHLSANPGMSISTKYAYNCIAGMIGTSHNSTISNAFNTESTINMISFVWYSVPTENTNQLKPGTSPSLWPCQANPHPVRNLHQIRKLFFIRSSTARMSSSAGDRKASGPTSSSSSRWTSKPTSTVWWMVICAFWRGPQILAWAKWLGSRLSLKRTVERK